MQRVLFHSTIFGPIHSRRLGVSLGVNLTPNDGKVCTFDCLYCEAGFNAQGPGTTGFAPRAEVARLLGDKLRAMHDAGEPLDVITFSGNGEPTLHPDFPGVIDDTLRLRNKYYPEAKVSVLSNSTRIFTPEVADALRRVDNNILKLDSAFDATVRRLNLPQNPAYTVRATVEAMKGFEGRMILQTMFLRGTCDGAPVDNTTDEEVAAWLALVDEIRPGSVMVYSLDRDTPCPTLGKVPREELEAIAARVRRLGIPCSVA